MNSDEGKRTFFQQRAHPRVSFFEMVRVRVAQTGAVLDVFARNLSLSGVFLCTNDPLPQGTTISVQFDTPAGMVQIDEAEVVWFKPYAPVSDGTIPGMGVIFRNMAPMARERLNSCIHLVLAKKTRGSSEDLPFQGRPGEPPTMPVLQTPEKAPELTEKMNAPNEIQNIASPSEPHSPPSEASGQEPPLDATLPMVESTLAATPPPAAQEKAKPTQPISRTWDMMVGAFVIMAIVFGLGAFIVMEIVGNFRGQREVLETKYLPPPTEAIGAPSPHAAPALALAAKPPVPLAKPPAAAAIPSPAATKPATPTAAVKPPPPTAAPAAKDKEAAATKPATPTAAVKPPPPTAAPAAKDKEAAATKPATPPTPAAAPLAKAKDKDKDKAEDKVKDKVKDKEAAATKLATPPAAVKSTPPLAAPKEKEPAVSKPRKMAAAKPSAEQEQDIEEEGAAPAAATKPTAAPLAAPAAADGCHLARPQFQPGENGDWKLVLSANAPFQFKVLPLENPPRLAIDIPAVVYAEKKYNFTFAQVPFVQKVRIGPQEGFVRVVIDFKGSAIPTHLVVKGENSVTINFPN